ncbi:MAG: hypothetical protein NT154_40280, partial [Verrucomicrobia bacterium]|nr:hypothetical protein [Verrucomicrobiota bacterium]
MLIWLASLAASVVTGPGKQSFVICLLTGYALHQAGKYLVAVEATRQFSEDRRSGALELLLVTPLGEAQILLGQKVVLRQRFHGLKWGLLLVNLCMGLVVLGCPHQLMMSPTDQAVFVEIFLGGMLAVFVDFMAIQWIGIWMSLRAQRQQRAVLGTLSRVM